MAPGVTLSIYCLGCQFEKYFFIVGQKTWCCTDCVSLITGDKTFLFPFLAAVALALMIIGWANSSNSSLDFSHFFVVCLGNPRGNPIVQALALPYPLDQLTSSRMPLYLCVSGPDLSLCVSKRKKPFRKTAFFERGPLSSKKKLSGQGPLFISRLPWYYLVLSRQKKHLFREIGYFVAIKDTISRQWLYLFRFQQRPVDPRQWKMVEKGNLNLFLSLIGTYLSPSSRSPTSAERTYKDRRGMLLFDAVNQYLNFRFASFPTIIAGFF